MLLIRKLNLQFCPIRFLNVIKHILGTTNKIADSLSGIKIQDINANSGSSSHTNANNSGTSFDRMSNYPVDQLHVVGKSFINMLVAASTHRQYTACLNRYIQWCH